MTLCVKTGYQCVCQPQDGVFCPDYKPDAYVQCLMDSIKELLSPQPEGMTKIEMAALERRDGLIREYATLAANWDSYGAEKFADETIALALEVSQKLGPEWLTVPCADGPSVHFYRNNEDDIIEVRTYRDPEPLPQE